MEQISTIAVGIVLIFGCSWVIKTAWDEGFKNSFHCMFFALLGVLVGLLLCYIAIFGSPEF